MMAKGYIDLFDRIDGGGAGKMGDTFKGGGILSMLANEFFKPYGSEDEDRKRRLMEARGLFDVLEEKTSKKSPFTPVGGDKIENKPVKRVSPQDMPYNNPQAVPGYNVPATPTPQDMPYNNPQQIPGYNAPKAPNPVGDMPAKQFMDVVRSAPQQQPVPFGGFQLQQDSYREGFQKMVERFGMDGLNNMTDEQLSKLLQVYTRGGPVR